MSQLIDYQITVFGCFIELGIWCENDFGHWQYVLLGVVDTIGM